MLKFVQHNATWQKALHGDLEIGGLGETTHTMPELRWYWSGQGLRGHCETRDEAVEALVRLIPDAIRFSNADAARRAEIDALPDHIKPLKEAMDRAHFETQRIWGRTPFNSVDYSSASAVWHDTMVAFNAAVASHQSRKAAA
jgi:hypothetical protein